MKYIGNVIKLFINDKERNTIIEKDIISCDEYGIIGDKFYKKDKNRSILLSSLDSYNLIKDNNIDIKYGMLGENILLDFDPHKLEIGSRLYVGDCILEISQECTVCNHLSIIDKKLPKLINKNRGIFAYCLNSAIITLNSKVYIK